MSVATPASIVSPTPRINFTQMAADADNALGAQLLAGSSIMGTPPRTEVGYVATVVLDGIKAIANAWEPHLRPIGLKLRLQGVFCHGSPQVLFGTSRCELADLLVVVDRRIGRHWTRRAALIQAKMARAACRVSLKGRSSTLQLSLYQHWPAFTFVDRTRYGSAAYRLVGSTSGEAGTFGVIDRHLHNPLTDPPTWTQHPPSPPPHKVTGEPELGTFLTGMLAGAATCGRTAPERPKDDWTRIVELLLRVTYSETFAHTQTLGDLRPRRGYTAYFLMPHQAMTLFEASAHPQIPPDLPPVDQVPDPHEPRGISIMHIEVGSEEG